MKYLIPCFKYEIYLIFKPAINACFVSISFIFFIRSVLRYWLHPANTNRLAFIKHLYITLFHKELFFKVIACMGANAIAPKKSFQHTLITQ